MPTSIPSFRQGVICEINPRLLLNPRLGSGRLRSDLPGPLAHPKPLVRQGAPKGIGAANESAALAQAVLVPCQSMTQKSDLTANLRQS